MKRNRKVKHLSNNAVNCVIFRKGEKEVLKFLDEAATQFINALELKAGDAERGFEPLVVDEKYQDYVNKTLMPLLEG